MLWDLNYPASLYELRRDYPKTFGCIYQAGLFAYELPIECFGGRNYPASLYELRRDYPKTEGFGVKKTLVMSQGLVRGELRS